MFGINSMIVKMGLVIVILGMLGGAVVWYDTARYNAGYNKAMAEYLLAENVASAASEDGRIGRLEELQLELEAEKDNAANSKSKAVKLQALLDSKPTRETYNEIHNTSSNGCDDLGDEYRVQLNKIIGEAPILR